MKISAIFQDLAKVLTATGNSISMKLESQMPGQLPAKMHAFLNVTAVSGGTPSLTMKLQYSYDAANWTDVPSGAMSAITAVGIRELNSVSPTGPARFYRWVATISGTTPSFTFDMTVYFTD